MVSGPMKVEKVGDASVNDAVIEIAQGPADHERQSGLEFEVLRFAHHGKKYNKNDHGQHDEKRVLVLSEPKSGPGVLYIRQVKNGKDRIRLSIEHFASDRDLSQAVEGKDCDHRRKRE